MRNELGFIPDNISAISNASLYMQPTLQHDPNDNQDSTDHLVDEILRQRAERLQREEEKAELASLDQTNKKLLLEIRDPKEEMVSTSEFRLKDSLKTSREKLSRQELIIPEINESIAEKLEMSEVSPDHPSHPSHAHPSSHAHPPSHAHPSHTHLHPSPNKSVDHSPPVAADQQTVEDRIDVLNNHTKGESYHDGNSSYGDAHEQAIRSIDGKDSSLMSKGQSLHHSGKKEAEFSHSIDVHEERIPKLINISISPSEKKSQRSLQIHNLIEERINEENSDNRSPSNPAQSHHSPPSHSHSYRNSHTLQSHQEQMVRQLEALQSHIEVRHSMIQSETPINLYTDQKGFYDFAPKMPILPEDKKLVVAITEQLNSLKNQPATELVRQAARPARQSGHSAAAKSSEGDFTTDYSEYPRQHLILQHRYESNLQVLFTQTRELLELYHSMLLDEEKKETRKALMMMEIENRREKISLRNASYSKRFNFISPIGRNNDKPIEYIPKFKVHQELLHRQEELTEQINHQRHLATAQEQKLHLLTRYYEHVKTTTIPHCQNQEYYTFDSVLGRFSRPGQPTPPLPSSVLASNSSPLKNRTSFKSPFSLKSPLKSGASVKSPMKAKGSPVQKVVKLQAGTPESYYNLLHYKRQIGKQMVAEFQVFTLGKLKRLKDENRLLKRELQFVDQHVENFDRQFAQELRQYEVMSKPKFTYQSFQTIQNKTPYTKSPLSRDYYANNLGSNNINVYRPDNSPPPRALSKTISHSKYTIHRPPLPNPNLVSPNTSNQHSSRHPTRKTLNSPPRHHEMPKQPRFKDVQLSEIAEAVVRARPPKRPLNRSNSSKKSLSGMKNLVKNRETVQTEQCLPTPSQLPQVTSEYYISFDRSPAY